MMIGGERYRNAIQTPPFRGIATVRYDGAECPPQLNSDERTLLGVWKNELLLSEDGTNTWRCSLHLGVSLGHR